MVPELSSWLLVTNGQMDNPSIPFFIVSLFFLLPHIAPLGAVTTPEERCTFHHPAWVVVVPIAPLAPASDCVAVYPDGEGHKSRRIEAGLVMLAVLCQELAPVIVQVALRKGFQSFRRYF